MYETPDGLRIVDGHLRKEWLLQTYGPDAEIEVNVTDLDDDDAKVATATKDQLAAMAKINPGRLGELMAGFDTQNDALRGMMDGLAAEHGTGPFDMPADADGQEFDESCADGVEMMTCPKCNHEFPK